QPDMAQVTLELVDIWHFLLSDQLQNSNDTIAVAQALEKDLLQPRPAADFLQTVEQMAQTTIHSRSASTQIFAALMQQAELSFDQLYRQYVGKNVLNFFRQDHGYKTGEYQKQWKGREDNEHLVEILNLLDSRADDFSDQLYAGLSARYQAACAE
ncbi:MAG: dUTP diphosphatase, partial [gamma proteobacterium symbiont of Bathyaustriella thionipta]|nr:dUTP diphosphatase [gamma proteobacterium symbiont of Bathyaustriella thionipta]